MAVTAIITAAMAVTGIHAKRTRLIEHTGIMCIGRIALPAILAIFAHIAFRARTG
jgi:hypothetical protein